MQTTTVKKKRFVLSSDDIRALKVVSSILDDFIEDEELSDAIASEACASVRDASDIVSTILNLDETEIDLC